MSHSMADNIIGIYQRHAGAFEQKRSATLFEQPAWDSFFHLTREDQRQMFTIFRQHANSLAALMFTNGTSNGEAIGTFEGEALYHASLVPEEYRQLLQEQGFNVVKTVVEDPDVVGAPSGWRNSAPPKRCGAIS